MTRSARVVRGFALGCAILIGAGLVALSENAFYLAAGSDASVAIYTSSLIAKLIAFGLFVLAEGWALFAAPARMAPRAIAAWLGASVLALGTHTVLFNHKRGTIEEFWLGATFDRAQYDISDGVAQDWEIRKGAFDLRLRNKHRAEEVRIFCGIPPWRVDPSPSLGP